MALRHGMRILVVSDLHGSTKAMDAIRKKVKDHSPDLVVICGDITHFGPWTLAKEFLDSIEVPTLAVPGNCDPPEVLKAIEESKAETLHRRSVEFMGMRFAGMGGAPQSPHGLQMEFSEERIFEFLDEVMEERAILVTHAPAWGRNDKTRGTHLGSRAILSIVEKYKPRLVLSGHIHEARGVMELEGTTFVNPGPARNGFAALIHMKGDHIKVDLLDGTN